MPKDTELVTVTFKNPPMLVYYTCSICGEMVQRHFTSYADRVTYGGIDDASSHISDGTPICVELLSSLR